MNKYDTVSESISINPPDAHPNIDMIIPRPYLFHYVESDKSDDIKANGIPCNDDGIVAYFIRIPEIPKYKEFLDSHNVVKISVLKLVKSTDRVVIKGINFPKHGNEEIKLTEPHFKKITDMGDKFYKLFVSSKSLDDAPHATIAFEQGIIPPFTFKVIQKDGVMESYNLIREMASSPKMIKGAKLALAELEKVISKPTSKLPVSVLAIFKNTNKMGEMKELLPMAKRASKTIRKKIKPEFLAAKAILMGIIKSNDSKSELIEMMG
jgi:hypothetical protein